MLKERELKCCSKNEGKEGREEERVKKFPISKLGKCQLQWLMGLRSHCSRPENLRTSTFDQRSTDQERGG